MQRKELNGKSVLRDEPGVNEQPFERHENRENTENVNSGQLKNKNSDPAETEGERAAKNEDEGLRGN